VQGISDRNVFDRAPLPPTIVVEIDTDYDKVEIREVVVGGSSLTADQIAQAVWDRQTQYHTASGTFGTFIKTLLTLSRFIGLQK